MLTGDTITNEQIIALRDTFDKRLNPMEWAVCDAALSMGRFGRSQRDRCAELLRSLPHAWKATDRDYTPACDLCGGHPADSNHTK